MMFLEPFRTYGVFKTEYVPKGLFYRSVLKDSIISDPNTKITIFMNYLGKKRGKQSFPINCSKFEIKTTIMSQPMLPDMYFLISLA